MWKLGGPDVGGVAERSFAGSEKLASRVLVVAAAARGSKTSGISLRSATYSRPFSAAAAAAAAAVGGASRVRSRETICGWTLRLIS